VGDGLVNGGLKALRNFDGLAGRGGHERQLVLQGYVRFKKNDASGVPRRLPACGEPAKMEANQKKGYS
jgi:hypothetical protein